VEIVMINENLKLSGQLNIVLKDKAGNVKETRAVKNLVVDAGLAFLASRMVGTSKAIMSHMSVGSGTTAAAAGQTDLVSVLGSRAAISSTTITGSDKAVTYVSSFAAGNGTGAVTEGGLFNASSGGDMLCRTVFAVVNKAADDVMSITWTVTLSAA